MADLPPPTAEWSVMWLLLGHPRPEGWRLDQPLIVEEHHNTHAVLLSDRKVTE